MPHPTHMEPKLCIALHCFGRGPVILLSERSLRRESSTMIKVNLSNTRDVRPLHIHLEVFYNIATPHSKATSANKRGGEATRPLLGSSRPRNEVERCQNALKTSETSRPFGCNRGLILRTCHSNCALRSTPSAEAP